MRKNLKQGRWQKQNVNKCCDFRGTKNIPPGHHLCNPDTSTWPRITYPIRIRVSVSDTPIHLCAFKFCRNLTYPRIRIGPILIRLSVSVLHSVLYYISVLQWKKRLMESIERKIMWWMITYFAMLCLCF